MVRHVVFFKFKQEVSDEQRKSAIAALRALPGVIEEIRTFEVGEDVIRSPRAWDMVLLATYDDLEALQRYAVHPQHVAAANLLKAACEDIGSVDYEYS